MKSIITFLVITLAVAAQGSYVPSAWPANTLGWNSWNGLNKWNSWNDHSIIDTPYVNSWASGWPSAALHNSWNGLYAPKTTVVQANIGKVNPWGLQWGGYGHGYNNYLAAASLHNGWNGWYAPKTTVVQANIAKVNPWRLQWGGYGHGYNNYLTAAPVTKYVTANPALISVAPHVLNQKVIAVQKY